MFVVSCALAAGPLLAGGLSLMSGGPAGQGGLGLAEKGRSDYRVVIAENAGTSSHSLASLLPVAKYFDKHPEYFSEIDGQRIKTHTQVCATNREAAEICAQNGLEWLAGNPGAKILSVTHNDYGNQCQCADCRADYQKYGVTGTYLRFVNVIADRIAKARPDAIVDTFAYQWTREPPRGVRIPDNVAIRYAPIEACSHHAYADPECVVNVEQHAADWLEDWTRLSNRVWIWYYLLESGPLHPYPGLDCLAENFRLFQRLGVKGLSFFQLRPHGVTFFMHNLKSYLGG